MKIAEKTLKEIPSKVEPNETLRIVQRFISFSVSKRAEEMMNYFYLLKLLSGAEDKEISHWLDLSEKTYRTHKTTGKVTKPALQEHVVTLLSLFKHGREIFGSSEKFKEWLNKENFHFNKKAPITFIDTISGIKFIDDRLTGLEYGDNA
jgi:uncharacterized protein (DUF2384 family)